jgi:hypothetical protein
VIRDVANRLRSAEDLDGEMYGKLTEVAPKDPSDANDFADLLKLQKDPWLFIACCLVDVDSVFYRYGRLNDAELINEMVAKQIAMAFVSDEEFRERYFRHYIWSRILIPDISSRVSQPDAIASTILDIGRHLESEDKARAYFWQDFVRILVLGRFLDMPNPSQIPKDIDALRTSLATLKTGFNLDRMPNLRPKADRFSLELVGNAKTGRPSPSRGLLIVPKAPCDGMAIKPAMQALRDLHLRATDADVQPDAFYLESSREAGDGPE